ncbi:MAG: GT2 family glycosyltransferase [Paraglaciecola sp.]|jgi:GT2 family glycosyltransferase
MAKLRKLSVLVVKAFIGILPLSFRTYLKKNPKLTALYSRSLQQAGLFYGFPSRKALDALYAKNVVAQNNIIAQSKFNPQAKLSLLVCVFKVGQLELNQLLTSISLQVNSFQQLLFWCKSEDLKRCSELVEQFDLTSSINITDDLAEFVSDADNIAKQNWFVVHQNDRLHPELVTVFMSSRKPDIDLVYVDSDVINDKGKRTTPSFYPDWNPDLQLSTGYISSGIWLKHLDMLLAGRALAFKAEGIAEWMISNYLNGKYQSIEHMALVLLHRSVDVTSNKSALTASVSKLVIGRSQIRSNRVHSVLSMQWDLPTQPLVSIIIPTKNGFELVRSCIESILSKTLYLDYEILLIDNNSDELQSLNYFNELALHPKIRVLKYPHPFNYSAINNFAVKHARGEVIALVNNDIEVISPEWLTYMVGHVMRPDIGCVGAKLLYADDRVQHAGVVMGYGGGAGHAHKYFPRYHPGYLNRLAATGNFSAVTAACLLVKKSDYLAVGGLNEKDLTIAFNDVDFCLKVLELGRRNLYCAEAELYHHESVSRGFEDTLEKQQRFQAELNYLKTNWAAYIAHDPAYNPNLTLRRENFSVRED